MALLLLDARQVSQHCSQQQQQKLAEQSKTLVLIYFMCVNMYFFFSLLCRFLAKSYRPVLLVFPSWIMFVRKNTASLSLACFQMQCNDQKLGECCERKSAAVSCVRLFSLSLSLPYTHSKMMTINTRPALPSFDSSFSSLVLLLTTFFKSALRASRTCCAQMLAYRR